MGSTQTKEEHNSNSGIIAQRITNNFNEKLDNIVWIVIAMVIILSVTVGCVAWRRCKSTAKSWVRKQTASNPNMVTVQAVPQQQAAAGNAYM